MASTDLYLRKKGNALVARDPEAMNALARIPDGTNVQVKVTRQRSIEHHRWFWRLCEAIAETLREMGSDDETKETVVAKLKVACGHARIISVGPLAARRMGLPTPLIAMPALSIAFHNMDQEEFREFTRRCKVFISTELLPHLALSDLSRQIDDLMKDRPRDREDAA
tara:strand:+ start:1363 stop:1863 length:501 start_codon:yes stop_codon:yes gene_type:complete